MHHSLWAPIDLPQAPHPHALCGKFESGLGFGLHIPLGHLRTVNPAYRGTSVIGMTSAARKSFRLWRHSSYGGLSEWAEIFEVKKPYRSSRRFGYRVVRISRFWCIRNHLGARAPSVPPSAYSLTAHWDSRNRVCHTRIPYMISLHNH